jgi:hypothetical protein
MNLRCLMLDFLQNMEETFLSYKVPMMKSFNPKGTYMILSFGLNSFIYPPRFLCSKGGLNGGHPEGHTVDRRDGSALGSAWWPAGATVLVFVSSDHKCLCCN